MIFTRLGFVDSWLILFIFPLCVSVLIMFVVIIFMYFNFILINTPLHPPMTFTAVYSCLTVLPHTLLPTFLTFLVSCVVSVTYSCGVLDFAS